MALEQRAKVLQAAAAEGPTAVDTPVVAAVALEQSAEMPHPPAQEMEAQELRLQFLAAVSLGQVVAEIGRAHV